MDSGSGKPATASFNPDTNLNSTKQPASQGQPATVLLLLQAIVALADFLNSLVLLTSGSEPDVKVGSLHA
jgi:hypothetical protein